MAADLNTVSGLFGGETYISGQAFRLEFRLHVDPTQLGAGRPYEDGCSGDIFNKDQPDKPLFSFQLENNVTFTHLDQEWELTGLALCHVYGKHPALVGLQDIYDNKWILDVRVRGAYLQDPMPPISVDLGKDGVVWISFTQCKFTSPYFRKLQIGCAVLGNLLDGRAFPPTIRFVGQTQEWTISTRYQQEGIDVTVEEQPAGYLDQQPDLGPWSHEDLNAGLQAFLSRLTTSPAWPGTRCFALVVDLHEHSSYSGACFDSVSPGNQGFAVFANNRAHQPGGQRLPEKNWFFTWLHEAAHVLSLGDGTDPESWMFAQNYNGNFKDWSTYQGGFTARERSSLRHADYVSATPGIRTWSAGLLLELLKKSRRTFELSLRAFEKFSFGEPIEIEVQLRNRKNRSAAYDDRLRPEEGAILYLIARWDNEEWHEYHPYIQCLSSAEPHRLSGATGVRGQRGADRFSRLISLSHGHHGISPFESGLYAIRAIGQYGRRVLASEPIILRVEADAASKPDPELERVVLDFLYHNGTIAYRDNEKLQQFVDALIENHPEPRVRARYQEAIAGYYGKRRRVFSHISDKTVGVDSKCVEPDTAVCFLDQALAYDTGLSGEAARANNLFFRRRAEARAQFMRNALRPEREVRAAIRALAEALAERGVKPAAIAGLKKAWGLR